MVLTEEGERALILGMDTESLEDHEVAILSLDGEREIRVPKEHVDAVEAPLASLEGVDKVICYGCRVVNDVPTARQRCDPTALDIYELTCGECGALLYEKEASDE